MTFVLLCSALLELFLGCCGIQLPLVCVGAFHFFVMRSWRSALLLSWCAGVFVDLAFARPWPVHLLLLSCMLALARVWRRNQLTYIMPLQALPGLVAGVMASGVLQLTVRFAYAGMAEGGVVAALLAVLRCGMLTALCAPLCLWGLDRLSGVLALTRYSRIGAEALAASRAEEEEDSLSEDA